SSHTVCKLSSLKFFLIRVKLAPTGISVFSHSGNRCFGGFFAGFPALAEALCSCTVSLSSRASSGLILPLTKESNDGPAASFSENFLSLELGVEDRLLLSGRVAWLRVKSCEKV